MRDQPDAFVGSEYPDRHASFVRRHVEDGVVLGFDHLSLEARLAAWHPDSGLRQRIIANMDRYAQETRRFIEFLVSQTHLV